MGTPDFAVAGLKVLVKNDYNIVGVVTMPDKHTGRGLKIHESAVKQYAKEHKLNILQPEKLKNSEFLKELIELKADLQIVVAFRMLPEIVWSMPRMGTFNLHASLLPQYRGAAPINWAIINGEKETGVTTFLLDKEIDTGKILFQEKVSIGEKDNMEDIHDRLMNLGADLILKTVESIADNKFKPIPQNQLHTEISLKSAPKIFKEDCHINWSLPAEKTRNLIRGLSPYPAAWTEISNFQGKTFSMKIFSAEIGGKTDLVPGTILSDGKKEIRIVSGENFLKITDLQISGKKRMNVPDFLNGFHDIKEFKIKI
ncbi:MAG: methionyl-tRNA formyltransferase [Prolixibacteraceae bacterium]|nr:methionyl-tRNA formyltransferase [Prolixibacteraceae bacterium]